jgi:hypothetical protein
MSPKLSAQAAEHWQGVAQRVNGLSLVQESGAYLLYPKLDLRQIGSIALRLKALQAGSVEVRLHAPDGPLAASMHLAQNEEWHSIKLPLQPTDTRQDIYFVFRAEQPGSSSALFVLDTFHFMRAVPQADL